MTSRKSAEIESLGENISDALLIGFEAYEKERTVLVVMRREEKGLNVINRAFDEEAKEIYKRLAGMEG